MNKSDLKNGNVVELRNGDFYVLANIYNEYILIALTSKYHFNFDTYYEDLTHKWGFETLDIVKVYKDYTCKELLWERKEEPKPKPKLAEDEKVILKNFPKKYKWIARDKCGTICAFIDKPHKNRLGWSGNFFDVLVFFEHLFKFIKWEDKEPYSIEELLGEENDERVQ